MALEGARVRAQASADGADDPSIVDGAIGADCRILGVAYGWAFGWALVGAPRAASEPR